MSLSNRISGKTVVVTGGSRGIGLALVKRLLDRGNRVIATTRNPASAQHLIDLQKEINAAAAAAAGPPRLHISQLDTADTASITPWALQLKGQVTHVDVLINNAGVYGRRLALGEFEAQDFIDTFTVNALGPFFVTQQLHKQGLLGTTKEQDSNNSSSSSSSSSSDSGSKDSASASASGGLFGTLCVNISSVMASHGDPTVSSVTGGGYAYRASKAALNIMNKAFALDLEKEGVASVLMHPGYVSTDMNGFNGWISAEESAEGILSVLESGRQLNNRWYAFDGKEIPW